MMPFCKRQWRRGLRGASPFEAVLGIVLFGLVLSGFVQWLEGRQRVAREREAGREMAILAEGVADYVRSEYRPLLLGAGTPSSPVPQEILPATLRTAGVLPSNFDGFDAMGRELRVIVMPRGTGPVADGLRVVAAQAVESDDWRYPGPAVFEARGLQAMGVVEPVDDDPEPHDLRLQGPAVDADIADFQAADFDGDSAPDGLPGGYALAVFMEFDEEDICGDQLYRKAGVCTNGTRMETALDMGGHAVRNASSIEAESMMLAGALSAQSLDVTGAMTVQQGLEVNGAANFVGSLEATGSANVTGAVTAASLRVAGTATAQDVFVTSGVTATSATVTGTVTAGSADISGRIDASSAFFDTLSVRSCSGC